MLIIIIIAPRQHAERPTGVGPLVHLERLVVVNITFESGVPTQTLTCCNRLSFLVCLVYVMFNQ